MQEIATWFLDLYLAWWSAIKVPRFTNLLAYSEPSGLFTSHGLLRRCKLPPYSMHVLTVRFHPSSAIFFCRRLGSLCRHLTSHSFRVLRIPSRLRDQIVPTRYEAYQLISESVSFVIHILSISMNFHAAILLLTTCDVSTIFVPDPFGLKCCVQDGFHDDDNIHGWIQARSIMYKVRLTFA